LIDMVIDSGPTAIGLESTVLDLTTAPPRILRPGPISTTELEEVLGREPSFERIALEAAGVPTSPGQLPVHYAPRTPSFRAETVEELGKLANREKLAVVELGEGGGQSHPFAAAWFTLASPEEASRSLYDVLHRCDALGVQSIIVVMPPDDPAWRTVRDRLLRATRLLEERS
jgi:L-threonylcarbamoyladenylate synthase